MRDQTPKNSDMNAWQNFAKKPDAPRPSPKLASNTVSKPAQKTNTSWGGVANWYDEYLQSPDSYQKAVILPNLMRILDPRRGEKILDLACGQGFFSEEIAKRHAEVIGVDISHELIEKADQRLHAMHLKNAKFFVSPANELKMIQNCTIDNIVCVLAAQNIKELDETFAECARVLRRSKPQDKVSFAIKHGGDVKDSPSYKSSRLLLVINHPSFRVPQHSDWHYEDNPRVTHAGKQGRVVYRYMSEAMIEIDMNPGLNTGPNSIAANRAINTPKEYRNAKEAIDYKRAKKFTVSYHRPLQVFAKWLTKNGFAITRIEEWTSHKKSQENGPRSAAEDTARREIPMFMCIEASLLNK